MKKNKVSETEIDLKARQETDDNDFDLEQNDRDDLNQLERPNSAWMRGSFRVQKQVKCFRKQ